MNICVYSSASSIIDKKYIEYVEKLCENLAKRGHNLVYGGGSEGLMGASARGFKKAGREVLSVIPEFFREYTLEGLFIESDQIVWCRTMHDRKNIMEDNADAFLILPGGIGTYDELFDILTTKRLGQHNKPIAVLNLFGYYKELFALLEKTAKEGFVTKKVFDVFKIFEDEKGLFEYLESGEDRFDYDKYKYD